MSQIYKSTATSPLPPEVATSYVTDNGVAVPVANILNVLGDSVAAGTTPVETTGSGNTVTIEVQTSQAIAASNAANIGLAAFDSADFTVDANGFVSLAGGGGFIWLDVSGAFSALNGTGYFLTAAGTGTLPAAPAQGDTIKFFVDTTQALTIQASGAQIIRLGSLVSSAGGTFVSTLRGDSVELTYRASDTCWCAIAGFTGTWTLT